MKKISIAGWTIFLVLFSGLCFVAWVLASHHYQWASVQPYWRNLLAGWLNSVLISAVSLIFSILVGILLTAGQLTGFKPAAWVSRFYIELVRGMPLLALILIGYYLVAATVKWDHKFSFGVAVLSLFAGAYLAEIFRAGVESIAKSQWLSARAIGLSPAQTYRYVVFPQVIRRVLPASAGQFANIIKDSSLLYVIATEELMMQAREANSQAYTVFEGFIPMAIGYLALTLPIFHLSRRLEKTFGFEQ